jgi:imidazole glycerol-phosphate synthase subunit HisH
VSQPRVVLLDYGSGNLRSAERALRRAGAQVEVTADQRAALEADGLVVPGVGAFAACMAGLREVGGDQLIAKRLAAGRPVLGICVGLQVLFEAGLEHGERTAGCGCWTGVVDRLDAPVLPHMGWNTVRAPAGSVLLAGLDSEAMFYFVHSYAARQAPSSAVAGATSGDGLLHQTQDPHQPGAAAPLVAWAEHGQPFVAAVEDGPLMATQFHPEKSGDTGAVLLANWLATLT